MDKQILCPLQQAALNSPQATAIIQGKDKLTYRDLHGLVFCAQLYLKKHTSKLKNSTCVLLPQNNLVDIVLLWALWREGAKAAPLNTKLPPGSLRRQIRFLKTKHILGPANLKNKFKQFSFITYENLTDLDNPIGHPLAPIYKFNQNQPITVMFTSGSSAEPKAAVHSFGNHYYNALGSNKNIKLKKNDAWLLSLPLYHVSGLSLLFRSATSQSALTLPQAKLKLNQTVAKESFSHISLVPSQLCMLLEKKVCVKKLQSLKAILLGGSAIAPNLIKKSRKLNLPVYFSYGMTEAASQIATTGKPLNSSKNPKCKVLLYRQLRINKDSEILVKGPILFLGYLQASGKITPPAKDKNGWFHTKDLGRLNNKTLAVTGRLDNMFISGGENIQPEEIEKHIYRLNGVDRTVVIPVKDPIWGMRPAAFIKFRKDIKISHKQLKAALSKLMPAYKIPARIYSWPRFVKESRSKIIRKTFKRLVA